MPDTRRQIADRLRAVMQRMDDTAPWRGLVDKPAAEWQVKDVADLQAKAHDMEADHRLAMQNVRKILELFAEEQPPPPPAPETWNPESVRIGLWIVFCFGGIVGVLLGVCLAKSF